MGEGGGGGEIIIKGGSVELSFDGTLYVKSADPKIHKHATRKITRVQVDDEDGNSRFDSGPNNSGLKWTITVSTR
jgi:hypothetical protein